MRNVIFSYASGGSACYAKNMAEIDLPPSSGPYLSKRDMRMVLFPLSVFILMAGMVIASWYDVITNRDRVLIAGTQSIADQIASRIESHISTRLIIGEQISREWLKGYLNSPAEFTDYTAPILELFPDFQAVNWVDPNGIIQWVTPMAGNEAAQGLALRRLPVPAATLALAEKTGHLQVTPPIELAQGGWGFVAYIPLTRNGKTLGFINIVFRAAPLIQSILTPGFNHSYKLVILDGNVPVFGKSVPTDLQHLAVAQNIKIADRVWTLSLSPTPTQVDASKSIVDNLALVLGVIFSALVAGLIRLNVRRLLTLRESESRLKDFAEVSSDWFWEMDHALRFTRFSGNIDAVLKSSSRDYVGKTRRELSADRGNNTNWETHLADLDAHRPFENFTYNIGEPDGPPVYISTSGRPVFDESGNFAGYRGTGTNVTAQREAERALVAAKEDAEKANHAKSEFLAHMSHELRTPLNSIIGFSDIWARQTYGPVGNEKYLEYARDINRASTHLLSIISDILDLSKIEAGEADLTLAPILYAPVVDECLKMLGTLAEAGQVRLSAAPPIGPEIISADKRALKQILINILSNALKFTPKGGQVSVTYDTDIAGMISINITDTGIGIGARDIEKVLEPFGQVRVSTQISHQGTGLGLPLAKRLTELQAGSLSIASTERKGTVVTLRLPVATSDPPA